MPVSLPDFATSMGGIVDPRESKIENLGFLIANFGFGEEQVTFTPIC